MRHQSQNILLLAVLALFTFSCKKSDYALPTAPTQLQNQAIKRTLGPNIVGQPIEFAYAGAILKGKLTAFSASANIAGGAGTYMENRSFYTGSTGADIGVPVGAPFETKGNITTVNFNVDTNAATLRYYYIIPEEARGKTVTITFTAKSNDGESVSTVMGPYIIAKMDMKLNMKVTDGALMYISIGDTAVYNAADAAAHAASIDLVYLFRNLTTSTFNHALVAPAADPQYLPGVTLPTGVNRTAKELKTFNLNDHNLAPNEQFGGIFVDDIDFQQIDLSNQPNYAINLKQDAGVWVETADGKYRAYIFVNSVAAGTATISMKRYAMK